jgi:hypothetical protein
MRSRNINYNGCITSHSFLCRRIYSRTPVFHLYLLNYIYSCSANRTDIVKKQEQKAAPTTSTGYTTASITLVK